MRLAYIQPLIPSYRAAVVESLAENFELTVLADFHRGGEDGFRSAELKGKSLRLNTIIRSYLSGRLFYQRGVLSYIIKSRPDAVLIFGNPRFASLWLCLLLCRALNIKALVHGQGLFKHVPPSNVQRLMFQLICALSWQYVAYNKHAKDSLIALGICQEKLSHIDNALKLAFGVEPDAKSGCETGILYIGRLRPGNGLRGLIAACVKIQKTRPNTTLHIIGDGEDAIELRRIAGEKTWITFYGAIYMEKDIADISKACAFGCYPGAAGLSVVHMFGLSLPPIVNENLSFHMGPEAAYISADYNGFLFSKNRDLAATLEHAFSLSSERRRALSSNAYAQYVELSKVNFGDALKGIIG